MSHGHTQGDGAGLRAGNLKLPFLAIFVLVVFWACDGGNLFGPGVGVEPTISEIDVPASVDSGAELPVSARAVGAVQLDSVMIRAQVGDYDETEVVEVGNASTDVTAEALFQIPEVITCFHDYTPSAKKATPVIAANIITLPE